MLLIYPTPQDATLLSYIFTLKSSGLVFLFDVVDFCRLRALVGEYLTTGLFVFGTCFHLYLNLVLHGFDKKIFSLYQLFQIGCMVIIWKN